MDEHKIIPSILLVHPCLPQINLSRVEEFTWNNISKRIKIVYMGSINFTAVSVSYPGDLSPLNNCFILRVLYALFFDIYTLYSLSRIAYKVDINVYIPMWMGYEYQSLLHTEWESNSLWHHDKGIQQRMYQVLSIMHCVN